MRNDSRRNTATALLLAISLGACVSSSDITTLTSPDGTEASQLLISEPSGLLAHYPMDGDAAEAKSATLNGTVVGGIVPTTDRFGIAGMAVAFNGTDSWLVLPGVTTDATAQGTINLWIRRVDVRDPVRCGREDLAYLSNFSCQHNIFAKADAPNSVPFRAQYIGMPVDAVYSLTTGGGYAFSTVLPSDLSNWHMYSFSWSSAGQSIHFDGQLVAQTSGSAGVVPSGPLFVGHNAAVDAILSRRERFEGAMDDLRIYDRALSTAEINALLAEMPDPRNAGDCRDNGWQTYGFANQGQCIRYLASGQDSRR